MKKSHYILLFLVIGLFVCEIGHATDAITISQIHLGFNNYYKRNAWVPLQLRLENDEEEFNGKIEVEIKNIFAGITQKYSKPLPLPRKALRNLYFYVLPSGITSKFRICLIDTEGTEKLEKEFTPETPKQHQDFLILTLTPNIDILTNLTGESLEIPPSSPIYQRGFREDLPDTPTGTIYVTYFDARMNLPDAWKGYDSIDLVVIRDISLEAYNISHKQQTALIEWIYSGGTLLVSGGNNIQYLLGSFLEPLLPVTSMRLKTETNLPILTQLFGLNFDSQRPDKVGTGRFELIDSKLRNDSLSLVTAEGETPIIAEREIGDGKVVFLAFDYSDPSFSFSSITDARAEYPDEDGGGGQLWRWLLNDIVQSNLKREALFDPYRRHEFRIRRLLSSAEKSHSPLLKFLCAFLSAYAIGFGLFLYVFSKRTRTVRMVWFGGLCVISIFTVFPISVPYVKKCALTANGLSIVNVYPQYARARMETYVGLLSSDNSKFNLQSNAKLFMRRLDDVHDAPYDFMQTNQFQYQGIQLNPWAVQTFYLESYLELNGTTKFNLQQIDGIVKGTIRNNLPFDLSDSYITYGQFYDKIGLFKKGTEISVKVDKQYSGAVPKAILEAAANAHEKKQQAFARIWADEGVLRYLAQPTKPKLIGWTQSPVLKFDVDRSYRKAKPSVSEANTMANQILVIVHM
ncbi:hypothetical protein FJZ31_07090 [Candidatus Poribacteria bacterium]|nr:hypothetical protein [Candidatus Poribacteria bacterium]